MLPLLLSLLAAPCLLQEPAPPSEAELALARAVEAQVTGAESHRVEHFGIDLDFQERGETPRELAVSLRYDSDKGGRLQLITDDSERGGVRVEKGFDGRRYWIKQPDQEPMELLGRDFARDRDTIDDTLDLCEELLLLFDLERLQARTQELTLEARTVEGKDGPRAVQVLGGTVMLADQKRRFELFLDPESWLPFRLALEPAAPLVPAAPPSEPGDEATPEEARAEDQEAAAALALDPPAPLLSQEFDLQHFHDFPYLGNEDSPQGRLLPRTLKEFRRDPDGGRVLLRIVALHEVQWRRAPKFRRLPAELAR